MSEDKFLCGDSVHADIIARTEKIIIKQISNLDEKITARFHWAYENFAKRVGYETRKETAMEWEEIPDTNLNKRLMRMVGREITAFIISQIEENQKR